MSAAFYQWQKCQKEAKNNLESIIPQLKQQTLYGVIAVLQITECAFRDIVVKEMSNVNPVLLMSVLIFYCFWAEGLTSKGPVK